MQVLTEEAKRNRYLQLVHQAIMKEVFTLYEQEQSNTLYRLVQENTHALRMDGINVSSTFMYQGEFYNQWGKHRVVLGEETNRLIHSSMMAPITNFMRKQQDFNLIEQQQKVSNYVINVLLFAKHVYDIQELIPDKFRTHLSVSPDIFDIGPPATEKELEQFRTKNISGLLEFKRLFLEELLLA